MKFGMRDVAFEAKQMPRFLIFYDGEDKMAKSRNCGLGATMSLVSCLRKTVICDMSWREGTTS